MELHHLLKRQLRHLKLGETALPDSLEIWQHFLERINRTYQEADQERYLNERSMEISSREMMDLNSKLEHAQEIAQMGYWSYEPKTKKKNWSKGLYQILDIDSHAKPISYQEFFAHVHPDDRSLFHEHVQKAMAEQCDYEYEFRFINKDGEYIWFKNIARWEGEDHHVTGVIFNIQQHKLAEEKIKELNQKIVLTARQAGMAEVATSMLHNIGNILNSAKVSLEMLEKNAGSGYSVKIDKILQMICDNLQTLPDFLQSDQRGRLIIPYLQEFVIHLQQQESQSEVEIRKLMENLQHITDIVSMQQSVGGTSSIMERIYCSELIDLALSMIFPLSKNKEIQVIKNIGDHSMITSDRAKLLQILTNLLKNAVESISSKPEPQGGQIRISVDALDRHTIRLMIADNGSGIEEHLLDKIFSFGFTTKAKGHGFGLHSAALTVRELGGRLWAESKGKNQGALFVLTLPK